MALATTRLAHKFIFGLNGDVHDNVVFADEASLLYVAGHNLVIYNTLEKRQQFIPGSDDTEGITALAICPNKRYCAVAERSERAVVFIYDLRSLRKRKNLQFTDGSFREYVSMAFSYDNQLLLTLGGAPDWTLICWDWTKARAKCHAQAAEGFPLYHCSFSPLDATVAVATGAGGLLKFFRVADQEMRAMPPPRGKAAHTYLCHAWLTQPEDHVLLGTEGGELVVFESGSFLTYLAAAPGEGHEVTALCAHGGGFVAGLSMGGFRMYAYAPEAPEAKDMFVVTQSWSLETPSRIQALALNPGEDLLAAASEDRQLYTLSLAAAGGAAGAGGGGGGGGGRGPQLRTEDMCPAVAAFHGPGPITGMDVAVRKPLVVTCSSGDRTVRVWNYATHRCEGHRAFQEEPWSCAVHPSGLHVAVGFTDKLRLMNLLMDDIRPYKEIGIKGCREVRFSHGGQHLAAVNGNVITVYDFYTCEKGPDLRAHSNKVRHLQWGPGDVQLLSCGQDGAVYHWEAEEGRRLADFVRKGAAFAAVARAPGDLVYAAGADQNLKELTLHDLQVQKDVPAGLPLGQLAVCRAKHLLFAGTAAEGRPGAVRAYSCPASEEHHEYPCMGAPITRMAVAPDDRHLVVADAAGCLVIFEIKDRQERGGAVAAGGAPSPAAAAAAAAALDAGAGGAGAAAGGAPFSEEVLVTRADLDERAALAAELQGKVDELITHSEYQLRLKEMNHNEKIKELTEKFTQDLDQSKNKYELLREEKNDMEMEMEDRLKQMEDNHQHELQELEGAYQRKIMAEVERYQKLSHELGAQKVKWEEQRALIAGTHGRYAAELRADFERRLEEDRALRLQGEEDGRQLTRECDETKAQLESDVDAEVQHLRRKFEGQLAGEREATLRYKGENGIMRKKFTVLQKEIEDQKEDINALLEKGGDLQAQIKALEGEIQSHKREIKDRDDKIGEKEKKIYELKKKNQELEKFKFVLNYKIKELKQQMEPREAEIARMKEDIKKMDQALERFHKSNAQLDATIGELRQKLDGLQREILGQRRRLGEQASQVAGFKKDLHECAQAIQDPPRLARAFDALYRAHVRGAPPRSEMDVKVKHEYHRHREFLEENLASLKLQFAADAKAHREANARLMGENLVLIKEINQQREDNREAKRLLQAQVGMLKRQGRKKGSDPLLMHTAPNHLGGYSTGNQEDYFAIMEGNKARIAELRAAIRQLEGLMVANKPYAKEVLPPMDGADPATGGAMVGRDGAYGDDLGDGSQP